MERRRGRRGSLVCRAELWERNGCKYGRLPCLGGGGPRGRRTSWRRRGGGGEEEIKEALARRSKRTLRDTKGWRKKVVRS